MGSTERYFLVLAGRSGLFYDRSGPAFAMTIRSSGTRAHVEAVGIHNAGNVPVFGAIPATTYREFLREPRSPADVMLRLEITRAQYERSVGTLRMWLRRAREGALLYHDVFMNNILLVKQVTEDLNRGADTITLYKLDWGLQDDISENNQPPSIPFHYFRELRRLNESRHVRDHDMTTVNETGL